MIYETTDDWFGIECKIARLRAQHPELKDKLVKIILKTDD